MPRTSFLLARRHGKRCLDVTGSAGKLLPVKYYEFVGLVLAFFGTVCWPVCFWWMHRISQEQHAMLKELHAVTQRIETFSKAEHDLIREVHPAVEKIKSSVEDVAVAVAADRRPSGT